MIALKRARKKLGLTLEEMGKRYGIDPSNLSRMERGLRHIPDKLLLDLGLSRSAYTCGVCGGWHEGSFEDMQKYGCLMSQKQQKTK
jgi:DNA-binding XRE family transcriptional regulator